MVKKIISASILSADFAHLADEVFAVLDAGCEYIHFDVMDNHFVPNLSFGAPICASLRKAGIQAPIDVHLMVDNPESFIKPFAEAGASLLTFHPETVEDVAQVVDEIHAAGMGAGLVFNPDKPVTIAAEVAIKLQMVLLMSVFPGFGGQAFMPEVLEKARTTRRWLDENNLDALLAIDGGIKVENIADAAAAGVDYFVMGSGIFSAEDYQQRIQAIKNAIA